jgi:tetratricopeptide (TPR) repeat protein
LAAATAAASPRPRHATAKYPPQAAQSLAAGVVNDLTGNYQAARNAYEDSYAQSPQPNTAWNLAQLFARLENRTLALNYFEHYLELAPDAPDRAEVQRIIDDLKHGPPTVTIGGSSPELGEPIAFAILDGAIIEHAPMTKPVTAGNHLAERISATTYGVFPFDASPGARLYVRISANAQRGNVLISGLRPGDRWSEGGHLFITGERFTLPPGHYVTAGPPDRPMCKPIELDVRSGATLSYVFLEVAERQPRHACTDVKAVHGRILDFGAP